MATAVQESVGKSVRSGSGSREAESAGPDPEWNCGVVDREADQFDREAAKLAKLEENELAEALNRMFTDEPYGAAIAIARYGRAYAQDFIAHMFRVSGLREIEQVVEKECPGDADEPTSPHENVKHAARTIFAASPVPEPPDPFIVEARKWNVLDDDALHEAISKLAEEDSGDVARAFMRRGRTFAIEMVADIHHAGGGHLFE